VAGAHGRSRRAGDDYDARGNDTRLGMGNGWL
jgi:hypothetical protein